MVGRSARIRLAESVWHVVVRSKVRGRLSFLHHHTHHHLAQSYSVRMKKITEYMASSTSAATVVRSRRLSTSVSRSSVDVVTSSTNTKEKSSALAATNPIALPVKVSSVVEQDSDDLETHQRPPKRRRVEPTSPATSAATPAKKARTVASSTDDNDAAMYGFTRYLADELTLTRLVQDL